MLSRFYIAFARLHKIDPSQTVGIAAFVFWKKLCFFSASVLFCEPAGLRRILWRCGEAANINASRKAAGPRTVLREDGYDGCKCYLLLAIFHSLSFRPIRGEATPRAICHSHTKAVVKSLALDDQREPYVSPSGWLEWNSLFYEKRWTQLQYSSQFYSGRWHASRQYFRLRTEHSESMCYLPEKSTTFFKNNECSNSNASQQYNSANHCKHCVKST